MVKIKVWDHTRQIMCSVKYVIIITNLIIQYSKIKQNQIKYIYDNRVSIFVFMVIISF